MINSQFKKSSNSSILSAKCSESESFGKVLIKGRVFWDLRDESGRTVTSGSKDNIVTLDAGILLARLVKGPNTPSPHTSEPKFGIYALAVGTGDPAWPNPSNPPAPTATQRYLYSEIARKKWVETYFVDTDGQRSGVPTNIVDFRFEFAAGEATGPLVEMGLIGGDVDTNLSNRNPPKCNPNGPYDPTVDLVSVDTLCNYVTFPVINKGSGMSLSWTWRLTF